MDPATPGAATLDISAVREDDPFHPGEQAVQERLGVRGRMRVVGQRVIRTFMPGEHQQFYAQLPFVLVGSVDPAGRPWASVLVGEPGFMQARDEHTLDIHARPIPGDPLANGIRTGAPLGFLGIELDTRRRNRMNGQVLAEHAHGFTVRVDQTLGNCPQYIQGREFEWVRPPTTSAPARSSNWKSLTRRRVPSSPAPTPCSSPPTHRPPQARPGAAPMSRTAVDVPVSFAWTRTAASWCPTSPATSFS